MRKPIDPSTPDFDLYNHIQGKEQRPLIICEIDEDDDAFVNMELAGLMPLGRA